MKKKQHKVGEQFEMYKLIYEVKEGASCKGCGFFIEAENHCTVPYNSDIEPCEKNYRDDNKDVIFAYVGESDYE